jgi:general secretion pathway protein I
MQSGRTRIRIRSVGGRHAAAGFTLLEAIVALVVFTMGAFVLYGWLSTNVITLQRLVDLRASDAATRSALELLHGVNPMLEPEGSRRAGLLEVSWQSTPVAAPRSAVTQVGRPTMFEAGLYELQVRVVQGERELRTFNVRQVGYRQVRAMGAE